MKTPKEMTICSLSVLVMPNGEILCKGKTVGWVDTLGEHLTKTEEQVQAIRALIVEERNLYAKGGGKQSRASLATEKRALKVLGLENNKDMLALLELPAEVK